MPKKIVIDQELCVGCGACASLCPEVFRMTDDGKSEIIDENSCEKCDCEMVVNSCPVGAMKIEE